MDELISHYPDIITVVDSCCELERTSAGRTSPSVSLTTLPSSLSPSHPDHQPDQKCKQDLIRFLNTSFKKGLRVVDGVNQSNQDFAHRKSRLNTFKDTWDKMKDDYGPVAAEFPSTTLSSLEKICTYSADHMAQLNTWISGPQVFDLPGLWRRAVIVLS